jgi:tetratricopeptide (TPR) repeat protein
MEDKLFVHEVLARKWITVSQLGEILKLQAEEKTRGREVSIRRLLLERGLLSSEQILEIIRAVEQPPAPPPPPPRPAVAPIPPRRAHPMLAAAALGAVAMVLLLYAAATSSTERPSTPDLPAAAAEDPWSRMRASIEEDVSGGRYDRALRLLENFRDRSGDRREEVEAEMLRVSTLQAEARLKIEAETLFEELVRKTDSMAQGGRLGEAVQECRARLERSPNGILSNLIQGRLRELERELTAEQVALARVEVHRGAWPEATRRLEEAVEAAPTNAEAFGLLARCRLESGSEETAEEAARQALRLDAGQVDGHIALGRIEMRRGRHAEACRHWGRVLEARPSHVHAWLDRAESFFSLKRFESALADAAELEKRAQAAHLRRGAARVRARSMAALGRRDEAIEACGPWIELEINAVEPLLFRGDLKNQAGDIEGARADYERAREIDPADPTIQARLRRDPPPAPEPAPPEPEREIYRFETLRGLLEEGVYASQDEPLWKRLSDGCSRFRAELEKETDPAARVLLAVSDPGAVPMWTPPDRLLQAALAWVQGRRGDLLAKRELAQWLNSPDPRVAISAARSLSRLVAARELEDYFRRLHSGGVDPARDLGAIWLACVRGLGHYLAWAIQAGDDALVLFLHLIPDRRFEELLAAGMSVLRPALLDRMEKAISRGSKMAPWARARLPALLKKIGGTLELARLLRAPSKELREAAMKEIEEAAAAGDFWFLPFLRILEDPKIDASVARWAHQALLRFSGEAVEFIDRERSLLHWRSYLAKHGPALVEKNVNIAIEKGLAWLKSTQDPRSGHWTGVGAGGSGPTGLAVFTLLHGGVPPGDPCVERGVRVLIDTRPEDNTYQEGATAMACAQYIGIARGALVEPAKKRLEQAVGRLVALQARNGSWAYGRDSNWDHSNIQLAMLGLAQAMSANVSIPKQTWDRARSYLSATQNRDGGWGYNKAEVPQSYGSMTAASAFGLMLAQKAAQPQEFAKKNWPVGVQRAAEWFSKCLSIEKGHYPHPPGDTTIEPVRLPDWKRGSPYYWLYSLARYALLADLAVVAKRDWYADGAVFILLRQTPSGAWTDGSFGTPDTCFAILFLRRVRIDVIPTEDARKR